MIVPVQLTDQTWNLHGILPLTIYHQRSATETAVLKLVNVQMELDTNYSVEKSSNVKWMIVNLNFCKIM